MKAIVLAGGYGTRLSKRVSSVPKPMAPISGRPFLEYILDRLIYYEINDITISVGYRSEYIISYFSDFYKKARIRYAVETEPLGTGGAILHAIKNSFDQSLLIINGDTFVDIDYSKFLFWYSQYPDSSAMVLKYMIDVSRYGAVTTQDEKIIGFEEKGKIGSGLINAGVYILNCNVFSQFSLFGKFSLENDLFHKYINSLYLRAFICDDYFIDIGIPDDYDRAQVELPQLFYSNPK